MGGTVVRSSWPGQRRASPAAFCACAFDWFAQNVPAADLDDALPDLISSDRGLDWAAEATVHCAAELNAEPDLEFVAAPYPAFIVEPFLTGCREDATPEACVCVLFWFERHVPFADFVAAFSDGAPSPAQGERWMIETSLTCAIELSADPTR